MALVDKHQHFYVTFLGVGRHVRKFLNSPLRRRTTS